MAWSCHYGTGCFVTFLGDISILKSGWNMKKIFFCPDLELFHCLPLWKTMLFVSSRAFSLSTPVNNSETTWKKATKCNKNCFLKPFAHFAWLKNILQHSMVWRFWTIKYMKKQRWYRDCCLIRNYIGIKNQTKQRNWANATFTTTMIESPRGANQPYPGT